MQPLNVQVSTGLKRYVDLALVLFSAVILSPLFAGICLAVAITSGWPIFYGQRRIGLRGEPFVAWKFRTMCPHAEGVLQEHLANSDALMMEWLQNHKLKKDPRVTQMGAFLRKSSLDELPQLWNILRGEMSFVGPRPIVREEAARYGCTFDKYVTVKPGLTGLWQISGRNNTSYFQRIQLDEYYIQNWSIWLDAYIVFRTVKTVLLAEGAY